MTEELSSTVIPETFKKYGSTYTMIERTDKVSIYSITRGGKHSGFEVMAIMTRQPAWLGGKLLPGGEALPSASQWGTFGWSFLPVDEDKARERFARSCKRFEETETRILDFTKLVAKKVEDKPVRRLKRDWS